MRNWCFLFVVVAAAYPISNDTSEFELMFEVRVILRCAHVCHMCVSPYHKLVVRVCMYVRAV